MTRSLFPEVGLNVGGGEDPTAPLAERMRPRSLEEVVGQEHLLGAGRFLREILHSDSLPSLLLWGPPGVGKTTLARLLAQEKRCRFISLSAVLAGVKEVKEVVETARRLRRHSGERTILFIDEIHRFNKAQQDAFLPHVESGIITLVGATTENPSFQIIAPLLSRCRVLVLHPLETEELERILARALEDRERGLGECNLKVEPNILRRMAVLSDGDARRALNLLEAAAHLARRRNRDKPVIEEEILQEALQHRTLLYDKEGEEHFNLISALHKSLRNSDADASLYWLGRMLEAGEDPLYIARRLVRFASEDVGLADPQALSYAVDAMQAVQLIGLPEGKLALAQAAVYLAQAPKSNSLYSAYAQVQEDVAKTRNEPVPLQLRNAPTPLMKELGYGEGYRYAHEEPERVADMECLPPSLRGRRYYLPTESGQEVEVRRRLEEIQALKSRRRKNPQD